VRHHIWRAARRRVRSSARATPRKERCTSHRARCDE
jgi:hypothetical protein